MFRFHLVASVSLCVACSSSGSRPSEHAATSGRQPALGGGGTPADSGGGSVGALGGRAGVGGSAIAAGGTRTGSSGGASGAGGIGGGAGRSAGGGGGDAAGSPHSRRYGFTLDSVDGLTDILGSLQALPKRMLVRIVFDYPEQPATYTSAVQAIAAVADIVGQPSDSTYSSKMTVSEYGARFEAYVSAFPQIAIWEACNECNGDWGGANTAAQADAAYDVIKAHGRSVLFTPYWNDSACADSNGDYLAWTRQKISSKLKQGADLVAVSIYGTDCTGGEPSYAEMNAMFDQLGEIFPNADLGIGEYGAAKAADKERVLRYYLDYSSPHPRYVFWGGYWYGRQDFVPSTQPLFGIFSSAVK